MRWRQRGTLCWLEAELPGARAAFSTRLGGVSSEPFASLNLGALNEDAGDSVFENRRRLLAALGLEPGRILSGRQIHGSELAVHRRGQSLDSFVEPRSELAQVDGQITAEPGLGALVFVADCLPVALVGREGVAMLHCGWRGLSAGIIARGAAALGATHAAIGPAIGPCCYQVGEEVLGRFAGLGEGVSREGMLDLVEVARRLLHDAGVNSVQCAGLCTSCEERLFFSHRRDHGRTGRQAGVAWIDGGAG